MAGFGPQKSPRPHPPLYQRTKHARSVVQVVVKNFLPNFSFVVTTATSRQTERTLSPETCDPAVCNIQPGTKYSGVHLTPSSSLSQTRTLLFVLHLDHLTTITSKLWEKLGRESGRIWLDYRIQRLIQSIFSDYLYHSSPHVFGSNRHISLTCFHRCCHLI